MTANMGRPMRCDTAVPPASAALLLLGLLALQMLAAGVLLDGWSARQAVGQGLLWLGPLYIAWALPDGREAADRLLTRLRLARGLTWSLALLNAAAAAALASQIAG